MHTLLTKLSLWLVNWSKGHFQVVASSDAMSWWFSLTLCCTLFLDQALFSLLYPRRCSLVLWTPPRWTESLPTTSCLAQTSADQAPRRSTSSSTIRGRTCSSRRTFDARYAVHVQFQLGCPAGDGNSPRLYLKICFSIHLWP